LFLGGFSLFFLVTASLHACLKVTVLYDAGETWLYISLHHGKTRGKNVNRLWFNKAPYAFEINDPARDRISRKIVPLGLVGVS
jgi:hypothetical protein